jgi:hypothetical protein
MSSPPFTPPPAGAYVDQGSGWSAAAAPSAAAPVGFQPPPVGLYGLNTSNQWAPLSSVGGGGGGVQLIELIKSPAGSVVTFSNISQAYNFLWFLINFAPTSYSPSLLLQLNGLSLGYAWLQNLFNETGMTPSSASGSSAQSINLGPSVDGRSNPGAGAVASYRVEIFGYAQVVYPVLRCDCVAGQGAAPYVANVQTTGVAAGIGPITSASFATSDASTFSPATAFAMYGL